MLIILGSAIVGVAQGTKATNPATQNVTSRQKADENSRIADDITLTADEIAGEQAWFDSLGVKGSPLVEHPFSPPWSNRSFIVPTAWYRALIVQWQGRPQTVSADRLRQDLPLLEMAMEKAYGGWDSAEKRGWNWQQWFADWDKRLAAESKGKELPVREAMAPFGELEEFQLDNHSGPLNQSANFGSGSRSAKLGAAPAGECSEMKNTDGKSFVIDARDPAQRPKRALLADLATPAWYVSYPAKRGEAHSILCGGKWLDVTPAWQPEDAARISNILKLAQTEGDVPSFRVVSPEISYLRLPTFTKANGELLRKLAPTLEKSAGKERLLIVDLRGNGGGDAPLNTLAYWIQPRAIEQRLHLAQKLRQSCLYTALRWGYQEVSIMRLQPPISDALRNQLQNQVQGLSDPAPADCPATLREEKSEWNYAQHKMPAKARFLVLVDNGCGSDCEFATYLLAGEPGAVIAGVNTYGVAQFIQPGFFMLPHTRIPFHISLGQSDIYGDGRSVDGYGLDVDLLLPGQAEQSPDAILKLAEKLLAGK